MKPSLVTICLILLSHFAVGQISDNVACAIRALLLEEKVSKKIFFKYDDRDWRGAYKLPPGNYAFICPDTTFQKAYKGILNEFPYTIATDGLLNLRKFYKDSTRAIYINGGIVSELCVVFKKIEVNQETATIIFFTTSLGNQIRFEDRNVLVTGHLRSIGGRWKVEKCELKAIAWVEYFKRTYFRK